MKKAFLSLAFVTSLLLCGCNSQNPSSGSQQEHNDSQTISSASSISSSIESQHEHSWGEPSYVWADDYSSCTAERACVTDPDHKESETATAEYHIVSNPTGEDDEGVGAYVADFENPAFETQIHDVIIGLGGTIWNMPTYTWSEDHLTCTAERVDFDNPRIKETETVDAVVNVITPAKCLTDGLEEFVADFENEAFTTQIYRNAIDPTGHNMSDPTYKFSYYKVLCTAHRECLNGCGYEEKETVQTSLEEILKEPTFEEEGMGRRWARFKNPAFKAKWIDVSIERKRYSAEPVVSQDGRTITYGIYPQSRITDEAIIAELENIYPEINGYYKYNDVYYVNLEAQPYMRFDSQFDNGDDIQYGAKYWFRCEPLVWDVLFAGSNEYLVVSRLVLDCAKWSAYGKRREIDGQTIYPNNYEYSYARAFLNGYFYDKAFTLNKDYIATTEVDNRASTTNADPSMYACQNTYDKLFLLSYKDYQNVDYGFPNHTKAAAERYSKTSEYARVAGVTYYDADPENDEKFTGFYWTRSPHYSVLDNTFYAAVVYPDGEMSHSKVTHEEGQPGIRPAMRLLINNQ